MFEILVSLLGILMSGSGKDWGNFSSEHWQSVELYDSKQNKQCKINKLFRVNAFHTMNGFTHCGGGFDSYRKEMSKTCRTLSGKSPHWHWKTVTNTLILERTQHCSWQVHDGIILMGGNTPETETTTEMAKYDGTVQKMFDLKEPAWLVIVQ